MSRQQFRLLVVLNQIFLFVTFPLDSLTASSVPPEIRAAFGMESSVMAGEAGGDTFFSDPLYLLWLVLTFLTLVAAAGLCFAKPWGRTLYVACFVASVLLTPLTPYTLNTGWTSAVTSLFAMTEGMIIGLVYFSHLRRMFADEADEEA